MNILLLGGAGFIGTNLSRYLLHKYPKCNIISVDDLSTGFRSNIADLEDRKNFEFVENTITDRKFSIALIKQYNPDVIISSVNTYTHENAINTYILGNSNILEAIRLSDSKPPLFILLSDDEVYGDTISTEGTLHNADETDALIPASPLTAAQTSADIIASSYYRKFNIPTVTLRSSNIYGPYQSENRLLVQLINHALKNEAIPIYGDGTHIRDWMYIDDFIELLDLLINNISEDMFGRAYNVSTEVPRTILEATELILTILNKPKEYISFVEVEKPLTYRKVLDSGRIKKILNWEPKTDFKDGIAQTINWFKDRS
jgi:dTDP-glucose 4,6-dehydratase